MNASYLKHHGVKGQKWGIQNGPPYPINKDNSGLSYNEDDKVFISGKVKYDEPLEGNIKNEIDKIVKSGSSILIGDAPGADTRVQEYLNKVGYKNVTVFTTDKEARNNVGKWKVVKIDASKYEDEREARRQKDIAMTKASNKGVAISSEDDRQDSATSLNIQRLKDQESDVAVWDYKTKKFISPNFLAHHGIKGQQWGVQHGPPYPLDKEQSQIIKKGSKIDHVSTDYRIKLNNKKGIYGYDPNDEWDSTVYKGAYSAYLQKYRNYFVYKHSFEAKEDLILPSQKQKVDTFMDLYKNNKVVRKMTDRADKYLKERNPYLLSAWDDLDKNSQTKLDREYRIFMNQFNMRGSEKASKIFIDALSKQGFNAIIDDNNAVMYNGAHNPLYIFSGAKSLKSIGSAEWLSNTTIDKNYNEIWKKRGIVWL